LAQDDYYYEIQLTNKQLVFYFLAGATVLVLGFLAGVMVGRGVDQTASADAQAVRPVAEDRIVTEEPPTTRPAPAADDLTYAQRLEGDKPDDTLEKPAVDRPAAASQGKPAAAPLASAAKSPQPPATLAPKTAPPSTVAAKPAAPVTAAGAPPTTAAPAKPAPGKPAAAAAPKAPATSGTFTIQVGAFKDRASAESVMDRLKKKGFSAYVVAPEGPDGGLFNVRVGSFPARADAERVQAKLRDDEKFKPFIVRN
jgi:cell division septation protein DedD